MENQQLNKCKPACILFGTRDEAWRKRHGQRELCCVKSCESAKSRGLLTVPLWWEVEGGSAVPMFDDFLLDMDSDFRRNLVALGNDSYDVSRCLLPRRAAVRTDRRDEVVELARSAIVASLMRLPTAEFL